MTEVSGGGSEASATHASIYLLVPTPSPLHMPIQPCSNPPSPLTAAHDLAGARLGQAGRPVDDVGGGKRANLLAHAHHQLLLQLVIVLHTLRERVRCQRAEGEAPICQSEHICTGAVRWHSGVRLASQRRVRPPRKQACRLPSCSRRHLPIPGPKQEACGEGDDAGQCKGAPHAPPAG